MRGGQAAAGGQSASGRAGFPRGKDGHQGWHGLMCTQRWMSPAWLVRSIQSTCVQTALFYKAKAHRSGSPVPQARGSEGRGDHWL